MTYPYNSEEFKEAWELWKEYKRKEHRFRYKSEISEQASLKKLSEISNSEDEAIDIIHESISNGWKGLFKLKNNDTGNNTNAAIGAANYFIQGG